MTKPIRFVRAARDELLEAATRYGAQRRELRQEFLDAVDDALVRIGRIGRHLAAPPGIDAALGIRRLFVRRFPFVVYYVEYPTVIRVFAVGHARRRPGYWRERLP